MKKTIFLALAMFVANSINASEEPEKVKVMSEELLDAIEKRAEAKKTKALERLDELSREIYLGRLDGEPFEAGIPELLRIHQETKDLLRNW